MSKSEIKKLEEAKEITNKYANKLRENKYPFSAVYLFGSYANGKVKDWSDMDVAVVSNKLKRNYDKNKLLLWKYRMNVDVRIEPHGFTEEEFKKGLSPLADEIKRTGIRVA